MTASSISSASLTAVRARAGLFAAASLLALATLGLLGSLAWHPPAQATTSAQQPSAGMSGAPSDWAQLSASQRKALAPLASQWASLAPSSRVKCSRFSLFLLFFVVDVQGQSGVQAAPGGKVGFSTVSD